jgi:hypothetical protein
MLVAELAREGHQVTLVDFCDGRWTLADSAGVRNATTSGVRAAICSTDWVILEYSPFGMGRWGFAPWALLMAYVSSRRSRLALFVHEPYLREGRGYRHVIALWQRLQLRLVLRCAAAASAPIEQSAQLVIGLRPGLPVAHIPVGSNLPDRTARRASRRAELGVEHQLVAAVFSTGHESRLDGHLAEALYAVAATGQEVVALNLGAGAQPLPPVQGVNVISPGRLDASVLAEYLGAADMLLSPLADGASMRRTTIAAALQHRLPVVSTDGHLTDRELRAPDSGIELVTVEDRPRFGAAAASLAEDTLKRERRSHQAFLAYARTWSWPTIVAQLLALLTTASEERSVADLTADQLPSVAITIPTYNQADFLPLSVGSAYAQNYPGRIEIWVFDDASTDHTDQILLQLSTRFPDLRVVRQPQNLGIAHNATAALRAPTTDMVVRLDSDDVLERDFVSNLARLIEIYPYAGYAHSAVSEIDQNGSMRTIRRLRRATGFQAAEPAFRAALSGHRTTANIMMFRKAALEAVNYCQGRPNYVEDYDLSVRLAEAGYGNAYSEDVLARYRVWSDTQGVRARRKALQLDGYRRIFEEVFKPGWLRRGWDEADILRQRRRLAARNCASCFTPHYTEAETDELIALLLRLGDGPLVRLRLLLCGWGLAGLLDQLDALPYRAKSLLKEMRAVQKSRAQNSKLRARGG